MTKEELKQTGEALIALSEGKKVQLVTVHDGNWGDFTGSVENLSGNIATLWRIKPKPKMRTIRVDELPYLFEVRDSPNDMYSATNKNTGSDMSEFIESCAKYGYEWTGDGIKWNRFEIEVME